MTRPRPIRDRARRATLRGARLASLALCLGACAAPRPTGDEHPERPHRAALEAAAGELEAGELAAVDARLTRLVAETQDEAREHAPERFCAEWLLAQAHARAAEGTPFLFERTQAAGRIGTLGRPGEAAGRRPSVDAHRVACIYHASRARALYTAAARALDGRDPATRLPAALADFGLEPADANLQLLLATTYARLGFEGEVAKTLARSPQLVALDSFLAALRRYRIPPELRPWAAVMVFDHLRQSDEEAAYRFAIVAIEAGARLGQALPASEIARLEDWILRGASVQFVDPKSQTPYLPGATRSPLSGTPHLEYVPVERR